MEAQKGHNAKELWDVVVKVPGGSEKDYSCMTHRCYPCMNVTQL